MIYRLATGRLAALLVAPGLDRIANSLGQFALILLVCHHDVMEGGLHGLDIFGRSIFQELQSGLAGLEEGFRCVAMSGDDGLNSWPKFRNVDGGFSRRGSGLSRCGERAAGDNQRAENRSEEGCFHG